MNKFEKYIRKEQIEARVITVEDMELFTYLNHLEDNYDDKLKVGNYICRNPKLSGIWIETKEEFETNFKLEPSFRTFSNTMYKNETKDIPTHTFLADGLDSSERKRKELEEKKLMNECANTYNAGADIFANKINLDERMEKMLKQMKDLGVLGDPF